MIRRALGSHSSPRRRSHGAAVTRDVRELLVQRAEETLRGKAPPLRGGPCPAYLRSLPLMPRALQRLLQRLRERLVRPPGRCAVPGLRPAGSSAPEPREWAAEAERWMGARGGR